MVIYTTNEWKGYGKQDYYWNEYRPEGDGLIAISKWTSGGLDVFFDESKLINLGSYDSRWDSSVPTTP